MTETTINFMDKQIQNGGDLNDNEEEILKFIGIAICSAKSAKQWPKARRNYLLDCRKNLECALIHLNEELDGEQEES